MERRHLWKPLFSLESETHCDDARAFTINEAKGDLSCPENKSPDQQKWISK